MIVVVPVGNTLPAGTPVRVIVTEPLQAPVSVASAVPSCSSSNVAVHDEVVVDRFGGNDVNVGGVVSLLPLTVIVTVWVQDATLPFVLSVAVQVIKVEPAGNGSVRSRSSLRRGETVTSVVGFVVGVPIVAPEIVASHDPLGAATVTFPGHVIVTGGLSSAATIVMIWVQLAVRPPGSVTVQRIPVLPIG